MTLYAVHHDWVDGHGMQGPVGIWDENEQSYYPARTEHLKHRGNRARSRPHGRSWEGHLEYLTDSSSAYNANWGVVESDEPMELVIGKMQAEFFADEHSVKTFNSDLLPAIEPTTVAEEEDIAEGESQPELRFMYAQTWWIASEFVRRHPDWAIRSLEGMSYLRLVNPRDHKPYIVCNPTAVHLFGGDSLGRVDNLLSTSHPYEVVKRLERFVGDAPDRKTPASTPRTLAYRFLAAVLTMTVNDRGRWEIQNEFIEDEGYGSGPLRAGWVAKFPEAERALDQVRLEDWDNGDASRHFWAVLRDEDVVAIVSDEGRVYRRDRQFDLTAEYKANGRRILPLVVTVLGDLLP